MTPRSARRCVGFRKLKSMGPGERFELDKYFLPSPDLPQTCKDKKTGNDTFSFSVDSLIQSSFFNGTDKQKYNGVTMGETNGFFMFFSFCFPPKSESDHYLPSHTTNTIYSSGEKII